MYVTTKCLYVYFTAPPLCRNRKSPTSDAGGTHMKRTYVITMK